MWDILRYITQSPVRGQSAHSRAKIKNDMKKKYYTNAEIIKLYEAKTLLRLAGVIVDSENDKITKRIQKL